VKAEKKPQSPSEPLKVPAARLIVYGTKTIYFENGSRMWVASRRGSFVCANVW